MKYLYNFLLALLIPFIIIRLLWKSRKNPAYRHHISERFAYRLPESPKRPLWIHTVSVGEFLAITPLLNTLCDKYPDLPLWLTCTTPTGREQIQQWAKGRKNITISYFPYDIPSIVRRFYQHLQPRAIIFMETEIWPNILLEAQRRHIATLLINARLSAKSLRGYYRYAKSLLDKPLSDLHINAQSRQDAHRFRTLNTSADISITPNLKYAAPKQPAEALTDFIPKHIPLLLAASTHPHEETLILKHWQQLRQKYPQLALCIAPRHPERRDELCQLIAEHGYSSILRSQHEYLEDSNTIAILDTLGELNRAYASATVAIIGGSFIEHGGHNPLEAIHQGTAVCFGPSMYNFSNIAEKLTKEDFAQQTTAEQLSIAIESLLDYLQIHGREAIRQYSQYHSHDILAQHYAYLRQHITLDNK